MFIIPDFLRGFAAECSPEARELGLLHEHKAIAKRHRRVQASWAPHLEASRAAIVEAAQLCPPDRRRRALVIGAGDCLDVPVAELAAIFEHVVLADIVVGAEAKKLARASRGRVTCEQWDASGALAGLATVKATLSPADAHLYFARADAGPPPGGEPDFIVSANCISQLGLVPGHSLPAYEKDKQVPERCAKAAAKRHLEWLHARPAAVRILLADAARLDVGPDGKLLKRDTLHERFGLPKPDKLWRWDLAPIPEWSTEFHRVHEVGAWIFN
ncbi:hypothetical protein [Oleiharenicola lentus]|uniref:hypothetical protein n=1 Tax=Oleiharenicola lentus TaxID=2508720 RepID=UPI003F68206E